MKKNLIDLNPKFLDHGGGRVTMIVKEG